MCVYCAVRTGSLNIIQANLEIILICGPHRVSGDQSRLSPRRPGLDPTSVLVRFVVDKVAVGQIFLRVLHVLLLVSIRHCPILIYTLFLPE